MDHIKPLQIAHNWQTMGLAVTDSSLEEVDALQSIYDSCAYIGPWCGDGDRDPDQMRKSLSGEHLPPEGSKNLCRLQSVRLIKDETLVGYLELYHGYPDATIFWLATLAIHVSFQHQGLGRELIAGLVKQIESLNHYSEIGIGVGLKNWPALRFWISCGFDRITKFDGDSVCTDKTFANLWLCKQLVLEKPKA